MPKQTAEREISQGTCYFCRSEFAKNKMTQHLKNCKARQAQVGTSEQPSQRLFHLVVEGKHRPAYWMHLEVPARATLTNLDSFLRAIWVECCDHLSEFTMDGVTYSTSREEDWDVFGFAGDEEDEEDEEGHEDKPGLPEEEQVPPPSMEEMAKLISQDLSTELHADLKDVPVETIEQKLEQMFTQSLPPGMSASTLLTVRPFLGYMAQALQQGTLASELEEFEEEEEGEQDSDVELGEVLTVGKKFSYVYDFGSSTELDLRVVAEREGPLPPLPDEVLEHEEHDHEEGEDAEEADETEEVIDIIVMARNEPPALTCRICGQPASSVISSSEYESPSEIALCENCAKNSEHADELLPIVNSPRVGVCGYCGDEEWSGAEWEEDEEEE